MKKIMTLLLLAISLMGFSQTTIIGTQEWMTDNLNVGTMIPSTQSPSNNNVIEKYCYNNDEANCTTYGGLYTWDEMMKWATTQKGICPDGFHVPTDADMTVLLTFLGTDAGKKLRESGYEHWKMVYTKSYWTSETQAQAYDLKYMGTDQFGFTALPAGYSYGQAFGNIGKYGYLWTSSMDSRYPTYPKYYIVSYSMPSVYGYPGWRTGSTAMGASVRCIKDPVK